MNNIERITIIANQIANKGKKPTVALIKAKLTSSTPLTQIISALRVWQHDPENCVLIASEIMNEEKAINAELTLETINEIISMKVDLALQQALKPIKAELAEVKLLLKTQNNI